MLIQRTLYPDSRLVQHVRVNHPRKKRSRDLITRLLLTRLMMNRVFFQVMSKLDLEKTPTSAAFKVSFTSKRICLLSVCLVVNQLPWAPVRSCKRSAFGVLRESTPQVRRITDVKAVIAR